MLLRFVSENFLSFNEETEFNLFPNSRSTHLSHHKRSVSHTKLLRMSAIYGANGAGKSNLVHGIEVLKRLVLKGVVVSNPFFYDSTVFRFREGDAEPISFAIEFYMNGRIYYYTISVSLGTVQYEELSISNEDTDEIVFKRELIDGRIRLTFSKEYEKSEQNRIFKQVLEEKLLRDDMLLLTFLAVNYRSELADVANAFDWFYKKIQIVGPTYSIGPIAHLFDKNADMMRLLGDVLIGPETGITGFKIRKTIVDEKSQTLSEQWRKMIPVLKAHPGVPYTMGHEFDPRVTASAVFEEEQVLMKELVPIHTMFDGSEIEMSLNNESDGTLRMIDYIPLLYAVLYEDQVFVVDEIERSLHPILIKEIISKISSSENAKGQLIFTTHESCLLDQAILRPDEIWFAEKDGSQATKLYPLSDFNIHHTANIENGYLKGRYGGIPFLSNLKDLNW